MNQSSTRRGARNRAEHDPRTAALLIIDEVLTGKDASQAVLDKTLRSSKLVPSDKRLCTELVYGYLRNALHLEWNVRRLLASPQKLPAEMLLVLGLAAYELAYLSRIPSHASVNWAVSRVHNRFGQGLAKVANGVLRTFARDLSGYHNASRYDIIADPLERLAVVHGVPAWIVRLWLDAYGEEATQAYLRSSSAQAVPAVRVNAFRDGAVTLRSRLVSAVGGVAVGLWGVAFPEGVPYEVREMEKQGVVSFQSAGVQEVMAALDAASWHGPVWDACAGRGGKTTALMELGIAVTLASDIAHTRIMQLPSEIERLGLDGTSLAVIGGEAPLQEAVSGRFATILADVPCSGLGTLSRRPEIRFRRTAADIAQLCVTQDAILDASVSRLQLGGAIIYLTCTLNPAENGERVNAFMERHPTFSLEREWQTPRETAWNEFFYGAVLRQRV